MIDFIIKSSINLLALLLFYHLILEKEKMHQFNRFYLLFSIIFSFIVPFITIEVIDKSAETLVQTNTVMTGEATMVIMPETVNYTVIIIWSIYGLVTLLLLFRFMRNILKINSKIKSNTIIDYKNAKLVLLEEKTLPHTFWNSIFINETDYRNRKIEAELYTHELIHVNQKHTLDVLFIEILKMLFWFNPIFIFYKKAIQLNHEFLADEKVITIYDNIPFYQNLLLVHVNTNPAFDITSNLNYSITKKRFTMMTKSFSRTRAVLYKIALLPLFSGLIYFMCVQSVAQKNSLSSAKSTAKNNESITQTDNSKDKRRDAYYAGVRIIVQNKRNNSSIDKMYEELTLEEKKTYLNYVPEPSTKKQPSNKEYNDFKNSKKYAIWIDNKHVSNAALDNYSAADFAYYSGSIVGKNARTAKFPQPFQFALYTPKYFDENLKNSHLKYGGDTIKITISENKGNLKKSPVYKTDSIRKLDEMVHSLAEVEKEPEFPGGIEKFYQFVGENFKLPKTADDAKLKGKIYTTFVIEKDGSLSDIKVTLDIGYGTWKETLRVLKLCPNWNPGEIYDKPVRTLYSLPITIQSAD
ncbi:M56 family metallopeptidase [Flavobacterium aquicola]|uniref:Beta-lactamase regulating signal transducer with metallopeptidase domain n=1 Tax=Flavobacterium aquicola TaxID=1682742 RepID=A0A3E0EE67_9FLAO|nr:M56 family metallopeptidase [Flavobacterium aquicola]REG96471.1 beta-lactamase regulating signal transducer with metallopeptidase domain [Flavobacterium aquicola]